MCTRVGSGIAHVARAVNVAGDRVEGVMYPVGLEACCGRCAVMVIMGVYNMWWALPGLHGHADLCKL
jgi:hypothetical protein